MSTIIDQDPRYLLSTKNMPYLNNTSVTTKVKWLGGDTKRRYKQNPHPLLGPDDIIYRFNSHGYRCEEFQQNDSASNISVISIGSNEVLGLGLPEDKTFPYLFTKLLECRFERPVMNWNLSNLDCGADYLYRMLVSALPILKPDIVLITLPFFGIREFINDTGRLFNLNNKHVNQRKNRFLDPEYGQQLDAYLKLKSDYNDQMNYYKNYQVCVSLCEKHKTMFLFSATQIAFAGPILPLADKKLWVNSGLFDLVDNYQDDFGQGLARDMYHPGIGPNREMADIFFRQLLNVYADRLEHF